MKLKYIGILRRDGSAPSVKNGDEVIKADENNVIEVEKSLADSLIESNLWEPLNGKGSQPAPAPAPAPESEAEAEAEAESTQPEVEEGSAQDKAALVDYAKSLGIDAKGTWGIAKLNEAIAKATASQE